MALTDNPVVLTAEDQEYTSACKVTAIIWTGTTTEADECIIKHRISGDVLWQGMTDKTSTYMGITQPHGIPCPNGFTADTMTTDTTVLVYLKEE